MSSDPLLRRYEFYRFSDSADSVLGSKHKPGTKVWVHKHWRACDYAGAWNRYLWRITVETTRAIKLSHCDAYANNDWSTASSRHWKGGKLRNLKRYKDVEPTDAYEAQVNENEIVEATLIFDFGEGSLILIDFETLDLEKCKWGCVPRLDIVPTKEEAY